MGKVIKGIGKGFKKIGGGIKGALFGKKGPQTYGADSDQIKQLFGSAYAGNALPGTMSAKDVENTIRHAGGGSAKRGLEHDIGARRQAIGALQSSLGGYTSPQEKAMFAQAQDRQRAAAQSALQSQKQAALRRGGGGNDPLLALRGMQSQQRGAQQASRDMAIRQADEAQRRKESLASMTGGAAGQLGQLAQSSAGMQQQAMKDKASAEMARRQLLMQQMFGGSQAIEGGKRKGGMLEQYGGKIAGKMF